MNFDKDKNNDSFVKKCDFTDSSNQTSRSDKQPINVFASFSNNECTDSNEDNHLIENNGKYLLLLIISFFRQSDKSFD